MLGVEGVEPARSTSTTGSTVAVALVDIESGGNPVIALVSSLRAGLAARQPEAARWLHRGLTSQDVVDSALMTMVRDAVADARHRAAPARPSAWPSWP